MSLFFITRYILLPWNVIIHQNTVKHAPDVLSFEFIIGEFREFDLF